MYLFSLYFQKFMKELLPDCRSLGESSRKAEVLFKSYVLITSYHCHGGSEEYSPSPRHAARRTSIRSQLQHLLFVSCTPRSPPVPRPCGDVPVSLRSLCSGAAVVLGEEQSAALADVPGVSAGSA